MRTFSFLFFCVPVICSCAVAEPPLLEYEIANTFNHSTDFFTQGLLFHNGRLYESTGEYGKSRLVRYTDDFSAPRISRSLEPRYFGEGISVLHDQLYLLTWKSELALIYDPTGFSYLGSFSYAGEGWGLTSDGTNLWMSNGSATLKELDDEGTVLREVLVSLDGQPLDRLNELEYVQGFLLANRWYDDHIYLIEIATGNIVAQMDLSDLTAPQIASNPDNVLNGIAWNPERQTLWVTGKNWSEMYELTVQFPEF